MIVCVLAIPAASAGANAQAPAAEAVGFEMGFRSGYGIPIGNGATLGGSVDGVVPITLDAGFRVTPHWYVGMLFSFGILVVDEAALRCSSAVYPACSGTMARLGVDAQYRRTSGPWARWVDFGLGFEGMGIDLSEQTRTARGVELAHVELGAGWFAGRRFTVGPFASLAVGKFGGSELVYNCEACSGDIPDPGTGLHAWLTLGLRMMLTLGQ